MFALPSAALPALSAAVDPDSIESALVTSGRFLLSLSAMLFLAYLFMLLGCAVLAVTAGRRRAKHRRPHPPGATTDASPGSSDARASQAA